MIEWVGAGAADPVYVIGLSIVVAQLALIIWLFRQVTWQQESRWQSA